MADPGDLETYETDEEREEAVDLDHNVCSMCYWSGAVDTTLCGTPLASMATITTDPSIIFDQCVVCYAGETTRCNNCGSEVLS